MHILCYLIFKNSLDAKVLPLPKTSRFGLFKVYVNRERHKELSGLCEYTKPN